MSRALVRDNMAASPNRLLILFAVVTFFFYLRTYCCNKSTPNASLVPFWRFCKPVELVIFRYNRTKFPVGKWSKHGRTTVVLPEKLYGIVPVEILQGGNIQPHPGPQANRNTRKQRCDLTTKPRKSTKNQVAIGHLNIRSMVTRERFISGADLGVIRAIMRLR